MVDEAKQLSPKLGLPSGRDVAITAELLVLGFPAEMRQKIESVTLKDRPGALQLLRDRMMAQQLEPSFFPTSMSAGAPTCECPPGTRCIPCTTGTLEVTVYLQTVCWDTDRTLGLDSPDRPFSGVNVTVMDGSTTVGSKVTDGSGIAVFDALDAEKWEAAARTTHSQSARMGSTTKQTTSFSPTLPPRTSRPTACILTCTKQPDAIRVLRRVMKTGTKPGLECTRKHSAPTPSSFTRTTLGPILWQGEPGLLVMRDLPFAGCGAGALVAGLVGFLAAPPGSPFLPGVIAIAGICLAFFGYFGA